MEIVLAAAISSAVTLLLGYWAHTRTKKSEKTAGEVAVAGVYEHLNTSLQTHITVIEERFQAERHYWQGELERERLDCDERISELAGRIAHLKRGVDDGDSPPTGGD